MKFSDFGNKFAARTGIVELMDDMGSALLENPDLIFMGGGNPARIETMEEEFQSRIRSLLDDRDGFNNTLGAYQAPQGEQEFRSEMAAYLQKTQGWPVSADNIAVSNGSQSAFFVLFNLLAGPTAGLVDRKIHLPLVPEYVGYADTGLGQGMFTSTRPAIELLDDHLFKYRVDFSGLQPGDETAALCVSRPTNPTGNVLTLKELSRLAEIARCREIPLIIDGAYGQPFPDIVYGSSGPFWDDNTVLVLSLSKLGLPGIRTGIIVGPEELIEAYTHANTIISLACGNLGPAVLLSLLRSGNMTDFASQNIRPYYQDKMQATVSHIHKHLQGLPYRLHQPEGAFFLWLWLEGLPGGSQAFYQKLKEKGVLVVPGQSFFMGLEKPWAHADECIRISYAGDPGQIEAGILIIASELRALWD